MEEVAKFYRQNMARQLGQDISSINREFGGAGRYTSGQRLDQIDRARENANLGYGNFLSQTALQRYLQEQALQAQADIAMAQLESGQGAGRTQMVASGVGALASIFAQNPKALEWLWGQTTWGNTGTNPAPRLTESQMFY